MSQQPAEVTPKSPEPVAADRSVELAASDRSSDLLELMQLFPRTILGMSRHVEQIKPEFARGLGPRHSAALHRISFGPITVGTLAKRLDITLSTASGVLADLDRAGIIARAADPADRRRTIVDIHPDRRDDVTRWLAALSRPLNSVLDQLTDDERAAFVKAMELYAEVVSPQAEGGGAVPMDCVAQSLNRPLSEQ